MLAKAISETQAGQKASSALQCHDKQKLP